ncbi:hypothetical protein Tco_1275387 [Tanacetum coccineum]
MRRVWRTVIWSPLSMVYLRTIKDYRNEKIDIGFRREYEIKINEFKENFNGMSIEINKKKKLQQLEQVANLSTYPSQHFNSFCYDDDDDEDVTSVEDLGFSDSNDDSTSIDDGSFSIDDIDYVDASPPDSELDDILHEKLLNINLLIAKIEALNANPTPSSDFVLKSPIPVEDGDSFLEKFETYPELETFKFDIVEKNSGSSTIHADISLPDLECV